ncbi:putative Late nodulin [Medicago truncatula]|uniref:Nodule Cysteine-Rich (NCR) secreted peptide n=1 Tax=Medicago truncatula TaxID=3880 RepID=G7KA71_MEDTR|nr:Nodule Cysteine-Rich (NCR) secreted peptide [Medicago truncatula]RHN56082.1 putative Late nodulin [Medicago truncatula]
MDKTLKYMYTLISFISLFFIAKNDAVYIKCKTDADCPKSESTIFAMKCNNYRCIYDYIHKRNSYAT